MKPTRRVVVWGSGNMGRAAIRSILGTPGLELTGLIVSNPAKVGRDAAELADLPRRTGVLATDDIASVLSTSPDAVAYMASGDIRPDEALDDVERCLRAGATVVSPSFYPLYDHRSAPDDLRARMTAACGAGRASLFVSGVDPGWGNDLLPVLLSGLSTEIRSIRAQELFDYSNYDAPDTVRYLIGFGQPLDYDAPMISPTVPTMVWGSSIRMMARALDVELDSIDEVVERRPLERTVTNALGTFDEGTQGALRFEVRGVVDGEPRLIVEHVTRIDPECAPDWPSPANRRGAFRVIIDGTPSLTVTIEPEGEGDNPAAGGNATAANRLIGAIDGLCDAPPAIYDALEVPLPPAASRLARDQPPGHDPDEDRP